MRRATESAVEEALLRHRLKKAGLVLEPKGSQREVRAKVEKDPGDRLGEKWVYDKPTYHWANPLRLKGVSHAK